MVPARVAALALTLALAPRLAAACSCAPSDEPYTVFPETGARVPANARFHVFEAAGIIGRGVRHDWPEREPLVPQFVLRDSGTERVVVTLQAAVSRPGSVASYELSSRGPLPPGVYDLVADGKLVLASYVVDAVADHPTFYLTDHDFLYFGASSTCARPVWSLPEKGSVRIGVAAVDVAGNRSRGVEAVLDVDHATCPRAP